MDIVDASGSLWAPVPPEVHSKKLQQLLFAILLAPSLFLLPHILYMYILFYTGGRVPHCQKRLDHATIATFYYLCITSRISSGKKVSESCNLAIKEGLSLFFTTSPLKLEKIWRPGALSAYYLLMFDDGLLQSVSNRINCQEKGRKGNWVQCLLK